MRWIPLLLVALAVAGASADSPEPPRARVIDRVAIIVDGEPIFASDVARRTRHGEDLAVAEEALIEDALVRIEARTGVLPIDAAEVAAAIEEIKKANAIDDAQLDAALEEDGLTRAAYELEVEAQLLRYRVRNVVLGGKVPHDQLDAAMTTWLADRRARAFVERPEAP